MGETHAVSQAAIDRYAEVSGDFNPLHVEPKFAATSTFGRTIAHGMMTMAFLMNRVEAERASTRLAYGGEVDVRFLEPVFAEETVEIVIRDGKQEDGAGALSVEARVEARLCATARVIPRA